MDIVAQEINLTTQEAVDVLGIGDDVLVLCTRYPWGSHSRCCGAAGSIARKLVNCFDDHMLIDS